MKRFTNASRATYHHRTITDFSDMNHLIATGVAKGYSSNKYSWVADLLFKHATNLSINPHTGYIGFISDRNIMEQEYGNVVKLHEQYPFLSTYPKDILPKHYYELATKQYFKIGQKLSEYDTIEYVNVSKLYTPDDFNFSQPYRIGLRYDINHNYYRSPVFYAQGYKVDITMIGEEQQYYDRYFWAHERQIQNAAELYSLEYKVDERNFELGLLEHLADLEDNDAYGIITSYPDDNIERLLDYKVHIDNPEFHHFHVDSGEWVLNHKNINAGSNSYYPYIGFVQGFDEDWQFNSPYDVRDVFYAGNIKFYPEITQNGVLEQAKTIINWGRPKIVSATGPQTRQLRGTAVYNPGTHLGQADDQSRIVYNICKHMTEWDGEAERFVVQKRDIDSNLVLYGVDVDTERNRRHSAVVMTEPYFTTKPIANGQIVNISFVNYKNVPIQFTSDSDFLDNPAMYLKIKAPQSVISELDRYLSLNEKNTDIIHTLVIKNPRASGVNDKFNDEAEYYNTFGGSMLALLLRQEFCLDDLIGIIGGIGSTDGHHKEFYMLAPGEYFEQYTNDRMKICGMGFVCRTTIDDSGNILPTTNNSGSEFLHVYCTNYTPISAPPPGGGAFASIDNEIKEIITDSGIVAEYRDNEDFKPMIKLPGINGYIKILERNPHFKVTRAKDGDHEIVYNVEFPFCPGSFVERQTMSFSSDHPTRPVQILYKADYINAGSWAPSVVGEYKRYDDTNDRYAPYGDDSFNPHQVLRQTSVDNDVTIIGEGYFTDYLFAQYVDTTSNLGKADFHNEIIQYPDHLIWEKFDYHLLSLLKPRGSSVETGFDFRRHGLYNLSVVEPRVTVGEFYLPYFSSDLKIMSLADNRQWNFDKNKYISFINRENPAYIFEMNVSVLFEDFKKYQAQYGAIPDVKRWLYGYFSGFAHMVATNQDDEPTRSETTVEDEVAQLTTQDAQSNIAIEIFDHESDVGNGYGGNWRPLSVISSDSNKVSGDLIVDNLFVWNNGGDVVNEFDDIYRFFITRAGIEQPGFPPDFDINILDDKSNLVLADTYHNKNYHIVHIVHWVEIEGIDFFRVWARPLASDDTLFTDGVTMFDPAEWPDTSPLAIYKPKKQLSKSPNFNMSTSTPSSEDVQEFSTRYIDIRSEEGTGGIPDLQRYISEEKIFFRVRVYKYSDYPVNYIDEDESDIQYIGDVSGGESVNFPWQDVAEFDTAFNWGKINIYERIKKFGATYFKCASK